MKTCAVILCALGLFVNYCESQSLQERDESHSLYCPDLNPQRYLDMKQVRESFSFDYSEVFFLVDMNV